MGAGTTPNADLTDQERLILAFWQGRIKTRTNGDALESIYLDLPKPRRANPLWNHLGWDHKKQIPIITNEAQRRAIDQARFPAHGAMSGDRGDAAAAVAPSSRDTNSPTESPRHIQNATEVYVLLADADGLMRSHPEPFGVAVTTKAEAERYTNDGGVGYDHAYQRLLVFEDKDTAIRHAYPIIDPGIIQPINTVPIPCGRCPRCGHHGRILQ